MYKIASWNVNSIKIRLDQILQWLADHQPDVLAIQETKSTDELFPYQALQEVGYHVVHAGQPAYNGVAIISKNPAIDLIKDFPNYVDPQRRLLTATIDDLRILNVYIPNGQAVGSEKYLYKLNWLNNLHSFVCSQLADYPNLVILGDFNIAPEENDVCDPQAWHEQVLFSGAERAEFKRLLDLGLVDSFRLFPQEEKQYSWWDYRAAAFRRNLGLRIDHILLSPSLAAQCRESIIDKVVRKAERPSDHAPVMVQLARD